MDFYQLNTRTAYSFGESTILPEEYVERGSRLGYQGLAIADDGISCYPSFADAASSTKAIFGCRIRLSSSLGRPLPAVVYLKDEVGYQNLLLLLSRKEEAVSFEFLSCIRNGLLLVLESEDPALRNQEALTRLSPEISRLQRLFQEDFYLGIEISSLLEQNEMEELYSFARDGEYKTVAFPKACYLRKADCGSLVLLQAALKKEKAPSLPEGGPDFLLSLKSLSEVYRPLDLERTREIADKCRFDFFRKRGRPVRFDKDDEQLVDLCYRGLQERLGTNRLPREYVDRLEYELSVIRKMDFCSYFLLVHDYVQYAHRQGIRVGPGRGSAAGSLVSYSLFITEVDPLRFRLSFERFLNPMRRTMPDIDIDFEDDRRDEVLRYLKVRYGEKRVSEIVTFVKLKPRGAIRLIGPALSYPENRLKKLTSAIRESSPDFLSAREDRKLGGRFTELMKDPYYQDLVKKIEPLIGLPINTSVHAAGVIVSQENLSLSCPLSNGTTGVVLYEYPYMERMGFLKMDILSLSNLTFLQKVESRIQLPLSLLEHLEDKETYDLLNRLELAEVFQLESAGMRRTIERIHPESFQDLCSLLALYRPGPMAYVEEFAQRKSGEKKIEYLDERLRPILEETYGIILYQEQVIEIVKAIGSFSASQADLFRRAISKKDVDAMEKGKERFLANAEKNGVPSEKARAIYADIERFAGYGFNKSHACAYALISFELLYLKCHFPAFFYQVALDQSSLGSDEFYALLKEIYAHKARLRGPDINRSDKEKVTFEDSSFLLPLSRVAQADRKVIDAILAEREKGPFSSFYQFCRRMSATLDASSERSVGRLVDAGAFDSLSKARERMKALYRQYLDFARLSFPESEVPPLVGEEDVGRRLFLEKEALGVILSTSLRKVVQRPGWKTMLVVDDSGLSRERILKATDGRKEYLLRAPDDDYANDDFLLVRGTLQPAGVQREIQIENQKGRKMTYGKDIHR